MISFLNPSVVVCGVVFVHRFCCPSLQTVVTFAVVKDIFSIFDLRVERKISSLMCYLSCIENEREKFEIYQPEGEKLLVVIQVKARYLIWRVF